MREQKAKISELFYSIQGEGALMGQPSIFIRTWGCNFECPGFGVERGETAPEEDYPHMTLDLKVVGDDFASLPVPTVGCDSSMSWSKRFRHMCATDTVESLVEKVVIMETTERPTDETRGIATPLVITGGEPLLRKYQKFWIEYLNHPSNAGRIITFETNGTQKLLPDFLVACKTNNVIFSISPKLSISGEEWPDDTIVPDFVVDLTQYELDFYLKFVVRDQQCIEEVIESVDLYNEELDELVDADYVLIKNDDVYLMPEGAIMEQQTLIEKDVALLCMKYGFRFSPRLHISLFGNRWGT